MEKENKAQITLLGIGSAKDQALKANLLAALEFLHMEVDVVEISNVNEILSYGISGIPALLLDEKVIFQKIVPSVEELCTALNELLQYRDTKQHH
ncbi:thioredoxin family protein [Haliscomenobacter hydrossis]|uniref:Redox-active disulfide protein 2 n=1 Tax=Haliscomenobacter hydrossis (strain ATCC 27775 / DSM 1100 / LMG 10767 / O) TaxID=760192 RepID=F4L0U4_HALH1|nr:thioredoxin family protein [Haliscomenobacter hydrossis]AEE50548.1 redox-active disulfide protein 2 [Haliscomenobacter hydrossis DSM 1100]